MAVSFSKTKASVLLDLVRGLAALLVLLEHWRHLLFLDYGSLTAHRTALLLPYLFTQVGHQAVVIFFVLSGYLISGSVFRMIERGQWSWRTYLTHRVVRLWVVLIPGLLLCALWDQIGLRMNLAPLNYHGIGATHMIPNVAALSGPVDFLRNLTFTQVILGWTFGSDGALWSLAYEFWFYILFPLGLFVVLPGTPWKTRLLSALGFVAVAWFVGGDILSNFPIWLLGVALALAPIRRTAGWLRAAASAIYLAPLVLLMRIEEKLPQHSVAYYSVLYLFVLLTVGYLWLLLGATEEATNGWGDRFSRELSRFSFTLYVSHTPLLLLMMSALSGDTRWEPTPGRILEGFGLMAAALLYCYGLATVTEYRTDVVRKRVEGWLGIGKVKPARAVA